VGCWGVVGSTLASGSISIFRRIFKFNRLESVSQFTNGLGYLNLTHMCVLKFVKSALCSSNNVSSRLANLYIRCSDFGHQLLLMNVQMDMPIYVINQSVHQHFSVMCSA